MPVNTNQVPASLSNLIRRRLPNEANSLQQQGGNQNSIFASEGSTAQTQNSNVATDSNQVSNTNVVGSELQNLNEVLGQTTNQSQTGTQGQQGSTVSGVNDTLGLSGLITDDIARVSGNENARSSFLQNLVNNGSDGLNENVEAAINSAVSGPGMRGVGNEALSRVASDAASNVARNATAQQLQGAQQLAGPTASTSVVAAGTPLLDRNVDTSQQVISNAVNTTQQDQNRNVGTQTNTNNTQTGQVNTNTNQASLMDLLVNQSEAGTQNAGFSQLGAAIQPESGGGGGTVICTALNKLGLISDYDLKKEEEFVKANWGTWGRAILGYRVWATPIANWLVKHPMPALFLTPTVKKAMRYTRGDSSLITKLLAVPFVTVSYSLGGRVLKSKLEGQA